MRRYHTVPHVAITETVGHHTANVIALLFVIYRGTPPVHLIRRALHHDVAEATMGDVPATAKWKFPEVRKALHQAEEVLERRYSLATDASLTPVEKEILKFADMYDLTLKAEEEVKAGNQYFNEIYLNGREYLVKHYSNHDHPAIRELMEAI